MSISEGASLLSFLDAPVLVGDPEGRAIYANPAYERAFERRVPEIQGEPLAELFGGGSREAVLGAVAKVCDGGASTRIRLREDGTGYLAVVSPIETGGERLGVVILLTEEPMGDERLLAFHREMQEPLEELRQSLDELLEQTGGRREERFRSLVETGLGALERAEKWCGELHARITGRSGDGDPGQRFSPGQVFRKSVARVSPLLDQSQAHIELLAPSRLPEGLGDAVRVEAALVQLLRDRVAGASAGDVYTLSARAVSGKSGPELVLSLVEPARGVREASADRPPDQLPPLLADAVESLQGRSFVSSDLELGRVTTIMLPAAP